MRHRYELVVIRDIFMFFVIRLSRLTGSLDKKDMVDVFLSTQSIRRIILQKNAFVFRLLASTLEPKLKSKEINNIKWVKTIG